MKIVYLGYEVKEVEITIPLDKIEFIKADKEPVLMPTHGGKFLFKLPKREVDELIEH